MNPRPEKKLVIFEVYSHFKELFKEEQVDNVLLKYQNWDYKIKFKSRSQPRKKLIYLINIKKLNVLRKYLDENIIKGFIREL